MWRTSREPAPKGRRGPSVGPGPGRGAVLRVGGLLMVLVTIAIMGVLGAKVVSSFSSTDTTLAPAPAAADSAPASSASSAPLAACAATGRTVELAVQAFEIATGAPPQDLQAVVDAGLLDQVPSQFEVVHGSGTVKVEGTGECERE